MVEESDSAVIPLSLDVFVHLYLAVRFCECERTEAVQVELDRGLAKLTFTDRARVTQAVAKAVAERSFT